MVDRENKRTVLEVECNEIIAWNIFWVGIYLSVILTTWVSDLTVPMKTKVVITITVLFILALTSIRSSEMLSGKKKEILELK